MKNYKIGIFLIFLLVMIYSCKEKAEESDFSSSKDTLITENIYFNNAFLEINGMLTGKAELDFKRAVFLIEWAYYDGKISYEDFNTEISTIANKLNQLIDDKKLRNYNTAGNYSLYEYFTKPNKMNNYKPYTYDFEDFAGRNDHAKLFVTKLLDTHSGQCRSLPILYKILCDEIGYESHLAFAPNHLYIKHIGEDKKWVNVELTNGHLSTDAFIISSFGISAEAIRNRIYMDAISNKEAVAHCLVDLANAYQRKYKYDEFTIGCCNTALKYFPHSITALMTKHNSLLYIALEYIKINGEDSSEFLISNHKQFKNNQQIIEKFGHREISNEKYKEWMENMEQEKMRQSQNNI